MLPLVQINSDEDKRLFLAEVNKKYSKFKLSHLFHLRNRSVNENNNYECTTSVVEEDNCQTLSTIRITFFSYKKIYNTIRHDSISLLKIFFKLQY